MRHVLVLAALLLAPIALAEGESYRYVLGTGVAPARTFATCGFEVFAPSLHVQLPGKRVTVNDVSVHVGGQTVDTPGAEVKPQHGGACFVPVAPGSGIAVHVTDDVLGDGRPFQVFFTGPLEGPQGATTASCGTSVRGSGTFAFAVPASCENMHVIPDAGSLAGTVFVLR